jgi:hypothetical protein
MDKKKKSFDEKVQGIIIKAAISIAIALIAAWIGDFDKSVTEFEARSTDRAATHQVRFMETIMAPTRPARLATATAPYEVTATIVVWYVINVTKVRN